MKFDCQTLFLLAISVPVKLRLVVKPPREAYSVYSKETLPYYKRFVYFYFTCPTRIFENFQCIDFACVFFVCPTCIYEKFECVYFVCEFFVCPTCIYKRFVCVYYLGPTCIYENFVYVDFAWVFFMLYMYLREFYMC